MGAGVSHQPNPLLLFAAFFAIYIVWGSTFLAMRVAVQHIPPTLLAAGRCFGAGIILLLLAAARHQTRATPAQWRNLAFTGLFYFAGNQGLLATAQQRVPSGIAALFMAAIPLMMPLVWYASDRARRPGLRTTLAVLLGFSGVGGLIAARQGLPAEGVAPLDAALMLAAGLFWCIGTVLSRTLELPRSPVFTAAAQLLCGGTALMLIGTLIGAWADFRPPSVPAPAWLGLVYLIVFGSLIGFMAYAWLIGVVAPTRVATYAFVNPIVAVLIGWAVAGETIDAATLLAMGVIVLAVAVVVTQR
ncbi:MAG: EamA family transporter [Alphaproteobacteria bacterium]|nr:EamA family transporter [Alphaproteobacteria bacterium]